MNTKGWLTGLTRPTRAAARAAAEPRRFTNLMVEWIPAKNFTQTTGRHVRVVVVHATQSPEAEGRAQFEANRFAGRGGLVAPAASAHYVLDRTALIQCVRELHVAWAAPGANRDGIHLEFVGYSEQTAAGWADAYSRAMLERGAELAADILVRYGLEPRFLDAEALRNPGSTGITTHAEVSAAFGKSNHWDPGPAFPMPWFLARVRYHMGRTEA